MALSLLESIRKLIRQDTVKIGGPVGNLHGTVQTDVGVLTSNTMQTWLSMDIAGSALPSLEQFFEVYASLPTNMSLELASDGVTQVTVPPNRIRLLRAAVSTERGITFTMDIGMPVAGSTVAAYVNGVLVRTLRGPGAVPVTVPAGQHVVYLLLQAPTVTVRVPRQIPLVGETDIPAAPRWQSVTTGYLDERAGSASNVLRWISDAQTGQYRVLRRRPQLVADSSVTGDGFVISVSPVTNDTYSIVLAGNQSSRLATGGVLLSASDTIGIIASVIYDTTDTTVICRLPVGLLTPPNDLVGSVLFTGTFAEIARVSRTANSPVVEYIDSAVTKDVAYEYALQATGLVDETVLSELSDVRYIVAGDLDAPTAITIASGYPKVFNRVATVRFTTPTQLDYAGVNVYYRQRVLNNGAAYSVSSATSTTVTVNAATLPTTSGALVGYRVKFNVTGYAEYIVQIASNTSSVLTLVDPLPDELRTGAVSATVEIYKDTAVRTDAGTANRQDELSFNADNYGLYWFASFDRSGNEQRFESAATWTYTSADDTFSSPPILAIRQLVASEQAFFTTYADTTRYVILELWAYDQQRAEADKFVGVAIHYQRIGVDAQPIILSPVPNQVRAFPDIVTSGTTAVLDDPNGTRSRFIVVQRNETDRQVRIWTQNALGQRSDITTFVADYDTTAEAVVETTINPLTDSFSFVVVVDDDTQGFTWQVDAGTIYTVDTRTTKRVVVSPGTPAADGGTQTRLELGQTKVLRVLPYRTYTPGPPVTVTNPGSAVVRDLVRTPRSAVTFDPRDPDGNKSATWVTAKFAVAPAPGVVITGRTGTVTSPSAGLFRLTDSGSPGWSANQYRTSNTAFYYLVLRPVSRAAIVVPITANGSNTLDATQDIPESYRGVATPYEILDGAVMWRRLINGTAQGDFVPTLGTQVYPRTAEFELEFYGTKNGSLPESRRRVLVDADELPSLSGFAYSPQTIGGRDYLVLGFGTADDDATTWEVYEKKGGWPTTSGDAPSSTNPPAQNSLDRTYLRFSGSVDETSFKRSAEGLSAGTWYAIAVPKNSFGEAGIAVTAQYVVGATPTPALTDLVLTPNVGTTTVSVAFPSNAQTPGAQAVAIAAVRQDTGVTANVSRTASQTPYSLDIGETIVASGGVARTWTVTAALQGYNTLTRSTTFQVAQATSTDLTATLSAQVYSAGACYDDVCSSLLSSPHQRLLNWAVRVNNVLVPSGSPYYVQIEYTHEATISGSTVWTPLAFGVAASDMSYMDTSYCLYEAGNGAAQYWTYRITVTQEDGTTLGVTALSSTLSANVLYCGRGGGFNPF